jgi:hypothetical protein
MATKPLPSAEYLRQCFVYDPDKGLLTWQQRPRSHFVDDRIWRIWNTRFAGKTAGWRHNHGYIAIGSYLAHRLIWKLVTGEEPREEIDHKDNDPANNRWSNLREATHQQNVWNSKSATGHAKGIYYRHDRGYWRAEIQIGGRTIGLGNFDTEQEANDAYFAAAQRHYGQFANSG